jgi:hypothetical protein
MRLIWPVAECEGVKGTESARFVASEHLKFLRLSGAKENILWQAKKYRK